MNKKALQDHYYKYEREYLIGGGVLGGFIVGSVALALMKNRVPMTVQVTEVTEASPIGFVSGKKAVMNMITYIDARRSGPPSWIVRHLETGEIYSSQNAAAEAVGISATKLSKHLNGHPDVEHVNGNHFERIAMAA
jgi:hypothetical protein